MEINQPDAGDARKVVAKANWMVTRKRFMRALKYLSKTWAGYRHFLANGDYAAAYQYISDMPDCSSKDFATFHIRETAKATSSTEPNTSSLHPLPDETVHAKRKAVANAVYARIKTIYFAALNELTEAWSSVQEIIDRGDFDAAHEYLRDMPDSSSKILLVCQVLDAEEAAQNFVPPTNR